jgi:hypothetical protein
MKDEESFIVDSRSTHLSELASRIAKVLDMHATQITRKEPRPFRARLSALMCLLAWFAATPSLLPASVGALGMLDGQHRVRFAQREGKVTVVFHHESGTNVREHHHSPLTNALTTLAEGSSSSLDHTFAFAQSGAATTTASLALPVCKSAELPPLLQSLLPLLVRQMPDSPSLVPRPPPGTFALVCLRSTTLRI